MTISSDSSVWHSSPTFQSPAESAPATPPRDSLPDYSPTAHAHRNGTSSSPAPRTSKTSPNPAPFPTAAAAHPRTAPPLPPPHHPPPPPPPAPHPPPPPFPWHASTNALKSPLCVGPPLEELLRGSVISRIN